MPLNFASGSNQYCNMGTGQATFQNVTAMTLAAWVKITGFPAAEAWLAFYSINGSTTSTRAALSLRSTSVVRTTARRLDADAADIVDSASTISTGVWHHLVATFGYNTQFHGLYIDGVLSANNTPAGWTAASSNTTGSGCLGNRADLAAGGALNAALRDVRIYNRLLSLNEMKSIYAMKGADNIYNGLIRKWKMQEGYNTQAASGAGFIKDVTGNQALTPTNNPTYTDGVLKRSRKVM